MDNNEIMAFETIQKQAVKTLATQPAGEGLCLIGGFRYRLLDGSCRRSLDVDYHWPGELARKQAEVVQILRRKLLPFVRERMGFAGSVSAATGPDTDSPAVKTVELAVWRPHGSSGRITIPLDITRIPCEDKPIARTLDGVIYLSASDADMIESKIVALFARRYLQERDMVDMFLFHDKLPPDTRMRIRRKFAALNLAPSDVSNAVRKMATDRGYHIRNIEGIVNDQIDPPAAENLRTAGGAEAIFDRVMDILTDHLGLQGGES